MAEKKKRKVKMSADRLQMLRKSKKAAGKSKSDYSTRVSQNKGVKDGTIRLGKNGKSYNIWDAKSGRWVKGQVKAEDQKKRVLGIAEKRNNARKKAMSDAQYLRARKNAGKSWNKTPAPGWRTSSQEYRDSLKSAAEKKREKMRKYR